MTANVITVATADMAVIKTITFFIVASPHKFDCGKLRERQAFSSFTRLFFHQVCAALPRLTDLFANGIVAVFHLVKCKSMDFSGVNLS